MQFCSWISKFASRFLNCLDCLQLKWLQNIVGNSCGRTCFGLSGSWFRSITATGPSIFRIQPSLQLISDISTLSVTMRLPRNNGHTVYFGCPSFWPGSLSGKLWYLLTSTRHQVIVRMNTTFSRRWRHFFFFTITVESWWQWSRLMSFLGVMYSRRC